MAEEQLVLGADPKPKEPVPTVTENRLNGFMTESINEGSADAALLHFTVRSGYSWANVYVRTFSLPSGRDLRNRSIELVINSDYGVYGHFWSHAGGEDWRSFIGGLDFDYAMQKLAGEHFKRPMNKTEFIAAMREEVKSYADASAEAPLGIGSTWTQETWLRHRRDNVKSMQFVLDGMAIDEDVGLFGDRALFSIFDERAHGLPYSNEMYEAVRDVPREETRNFWDRLFAPFQSYLRDQIKAEKTA